MTRAEDLKRLNAAMPDGAMIAVDWSRGTSEHVEQEFWAIPLPEGKDAIDAIVNLVAMRCAAVIEARALPGRDGRPDLTELDNFSAYGVKQDLDVLRDMRCQFGPLRHDAPTWLDDLILSDWGRS